jgi:hypothetical protein
MLAAQANIAEVPEVTDGEWTVEVVLHAHATPVTAWLGGQWGGIDMGLWSSVKVGQECLVVFPEGDFEGRPVVVAFLSSTGQDATHLPEEMVVGDKMRQDRVLLISTEDVQIITVGGGTVSIMQRGGTSSPVATLADVQALKQHVDGHRHLTPTFAVPAGQPSTVPDQSSPPFPSVTPDPAPTPTGTQILEAE